MCSHTRRNTRPLSTSGKATAQHAIETLVAQRVLGMVLYRRQVRHSIRSPLQMVLGFLLQRSGPRTRREALVGLQTLKV